MDNLQHYMQADVLETNFSRLMNAVSKTNDFERLKKAHATFLADVLSQSFSTVVSVSIYFLAKFISIRRAR
jgi:gamma-tubulin complex component 4